MLIHNSGHSNSKIVVYKKNLRNLIQNFRFRIKVSDINSKHIESIVDNNYPFKPW